MNNSKKILVWLALSSLMLGSCKKQFLDLTPYDQVPLDQSIVDENSMQTAVNGMYAGLRATDYYGRTVIIDGDLMADNVYISADNSNRYIPELTFTYLPTYGTVQNLWAEAYAVILRANNIIQSKIPVDDNVNQLVGEALTIRALSYFELARFYAKPYAVDPTSPGVPLVLEYNPHLLPSRATVQDVYTQIENDLTKAIGLMTMDKNSSYASKYMAEGLLARLYLFEGQWDKAQAAALDVVTNGGYSLVDSAGLVKYWAATGTRDDKVETMLEVQFDLINNNGTDALDAFFDQFFGGYGDALCTDNLYNLYSNTDARKTLIVPANRAGVDVWAVNKYPNTGNPSGTDNTKVLRYAEVLLTLAEAYNRLNDDADAKIYLNQLATIRDPSFAGYTSTGATLLNDIINERRKELAFEGERYWDLTRLNQDVVRDNSTGNYLVNVPLTLSASDTKRIYPIPQAEINANKNVAQNPGY